MNDASCAVVAGGNGVIFTAIDAVIAVLVDVIVEGCM